MNFIMNKNNDLCHRKADSLTHITFWWQICLPCGNVCWINFFLLSGGCDNCQCSTHLDAL